MHHEQCSHSDHSASLVRQTDFSERRLKKTMHIFKCGNITDTKLKLDENLKVKVTANEEKQFAGKE